MKSKRSVLRNLLMVSFPCISRTTNVLAETAALWVQRIYTYVQNELQEFSDVQEDSTAVEQHTNPAFIAYIKGEIPEPGACCRQTVATKKCESHHLKKTIREKTSKKARRAKKHVPTCQKRRVVGSIPNLQMKPSPGVELVCRRRRGFISAETVFQGSTDHIHDCHDNHTHTLESATGDSINSRIGAEKINRLRLPGILLVVAVVNALLRVVGTFCAYVKREWTEANDIYGFESADVQYTEPAFIAYVKGEDTAPYIS